MLLNPLYKPASALTIGGATIDVILPVADSHIALAGKHDVPFINFAAGGGAVNAATVLNKLGRNVSAYCAIGDDPEGELLCARLTQVGISLDKVEIIENVKTGRAVISVQKDGDVAIFADRGANLSLDGKALTQEVHTDLLYISSIPDLALEKIFDFISHIAPKDMYVAWNPGSGQIRSGGSVFAKLLECTDTLLMNAEEAATVLNLRRGQMVTSSAKESCLELMRGSKAHVCITDGANGVWVGKNGEIFHQAAISGRVASAVGAGDTFGATFAHFIANGVEPRQAAHWAVHNAHASLAGYDAVSQSLSEKTLSNQVMS